VDVEAIFSGLNPDQLRAVETVRGPVCILAGAGTGKTTTITRRVAHQVASGTFRADEILAVTFTDKAAAEMRGRLRTLGVEGVRASTFHAAALGMLHRFRGEPPGRILPSKAMVLRQIGNGLPRPYRFRPAVDLATEVEWAKNRRLTPASYLDGLGAHEPPIPPDLAARVFRDYERRKTALGAVDFEDLLELAVRLLDEDRWALAEVRERYRAFTVDEYQDVNLLQETLLERWLGAREDLCAVGDDYQSIYAFTGATPQYLLDLPRRFPHTVVVRLERNYRSAPEVLELANRLVPRLGGAEKQLRATRPAGEPPELRAFAGPPAETEFVVERIRTLAAAGVPLEQMAILTRTNARTADFEEALHEAVIPFQGAALLEREAARQLRKALRSDPSTAVATTVRRAAVQAGWQEQPPERLGERELSRQTDLSRLVRLAEEFEDGDRTVADFLSDLERRFGRDAGRGVHLLTYHRSKGLEFEAVFLPRLEEKELPSRQARGDEIDEERRLLYVGMTRAKRWLTITWSGKPSRFLAELGVEARPLKVTADVGLDRASPGVQKLREWRLERARSEGVPAYVVFNDRTLAELLRRAPTTPAELAAVPGIGPAKLERYGRDLLVVVREAAAAAPATAPAEARDPMADDLYRALAVWRRAQAAQQDVPAFHVFANRTLDAIARARPRTLDELAAVPGIGAAKLDRYGEEVLATIADALRAAA
jgi:DNA helicase-2/ATP-dependent DNA helicase PcrA